MKRVLWGLQFFGVVLLSFPLSILPCRVGEFLGLLLHYLWKSRRAIAVDNLKRSISLNALSITGTPEEIIRDSFKNLGLSFIEIIKVYYGRGERMLDKIAIRGMENLDGAKARGKGILFITGHCGNWELLAIASSVKVTPLSVVARPLNNPYLNRFLDRARSRYGNRVIYKKGALRGIVSTLRSGGSVGILMDQAVLPDEGYVIEFLGRGAWTTKMPALIARRTDAPVLPVFIRRKGHGHEITIHPEVSLSPNNSLEIALKEDTKTFSDIIANYIRENPSEWLWLHRRWKRVP